MTRDETAAALTEFARPIDQLEQAVAALPWDQAEPAKVVLLARHVRTAIDRYELGKLTADAIERWANLLEAREDIAMDHSLRSVIFDLANPALQGSFEEILPTIKTRIS